MRPSSVIPSKDALFLYGTAIRVGECERLDLRDVDLLRGQLFVRLGKGRKDRVVPVVGRAAAALDVYLRDSRPELVHDPREQALFLTNRGTRLPVRSTPTWRPSTCFAPSRRLILGRGPGGAGGKIRPS